MGDTLQIHYTVRLNCHLQSGADFKSKCACVCVCVCAFYGRLPSWWRAQLLSMWHHVFRPFLQTETKLQSRTADWNDLISDHGAYDVLWPKTWYFLKYVFSIWCEKIASAPLGVMGRCNTSAVDRCRTAQSRFIHPHIVHEWNFRFIQSFPSCLELRFHGVFRNSAQNQHAPRNEKKNHIL